MNEVVVKPISAETIGRLAEQLARQMAHQQALLRGKGGQENGGKEELLPIAQPPA